MQVDSATSRRFLHAAAGDRRRVASLVLVILFGVVLRLGMGVPRVRIPLDAPELGTDEGMYIALARSLKDNRSFATASEENFFDQAFWPFGEATPGALKPNLLRTPLFPAMLVAPLAIRTNFASILVFNCVVFALACLALYWIGTNLGHRKASLAAAAMFALDPLAILNATKALSDLPLLLLLLASVGSFLEASKADRSDWALLGYLLLGLAALTKPVAFYLIPPLALTWALFRRRSHGLRETLTGLAICSLLVGTWVARNYYIYRVPTLSSASAFNAVEFRAMAEVQSDKSFVQNFFDPELSTQSYEKRDALLKQLYARLDPASTNAQRFAALKEDGASFFRARPALLGKLWLTGAARLLLNGAWTKYVSSPGRVRAWHAAFALINAIAMGLALIGGARLWRSGKRLPLSLIVLLFVVLAVLSSPAANPRLRLSFIPLVYFVAAIGWLATWHAIRPTALRGRVP